MRKNKIQDPFPALPRTCMSGVDPQRAHCKTHFDVTNCPWVRYVDVMWALGGKITWAYVSKPFQSRLQNPATARPSTCCTSQSRDREDEFCAQYPANLAYQGPAVSSAELMYAMRELSSWVLKRTIIGIRTEVPVHVHHVVKLVSGNNQ